MTRNMTILEVIAHKKGDGLMMTRHFVKANNESDAQASLNAKVGKGVYRVLTSVKHDFDTTLDDEIYLSLCKVTAIDGVVLAEAVTYEKAMEIVIEKAKAENN